jgi:hypothetical protein
MNRAEPSFSARDPHTVMTLRIVGLFQKDLRIALQALEHVKPVRYERKLQGPVEAPELSAYGNGP